MKKNKLITGIVLNIVNIIFIVTCSIFSLTGLNWMGIGGRLTPDSTNLFSLFTVDSNILLGICSVIILVYEFLLLKGKIEKIPLFAFILKYIATSAVALTFLTILLVFVPMMKENFWQMYTNNNLFFHLICPVIAIVSLLVAEHTSELKFKHTFFGLAPAGIYAIYYSINVLIHMNPDGTVDTKYDPYYFAQNGWGGIIFSFVGMLVFAYIISFLLFLFSSLIAKKERV